MLSPVTLICLAGSGLGAGPASTAPSVIEYSLPWHGQSIRPLAIWLTVQPICVQTALKALNWPADGWVTTTTCEGKIFPPPTGMAPVPDSAPAATPPAEPDEPGEEEARGPGRARSTRGAAGGGGRPPPPPPP